MEINLIKKIFLFIFLVFGLFSSTSFAKERNIFSDDYEIHFASDLNDKMKVLFVGDNLNTSFFSSNIFLKKNIDSCDYSYYDLIFLLDGKDNKLNENYIYFDKKDNTFKMNFKNQKLNSKTFYSYDYLSNLFKTNREKNKLEENFNYFKKNLLIVDLNSLKDPDENKKEYQALRKYFKDDYTSKEIILFLNSKDNSMLKDKFLLLSEGENIFSEKDFPSDLQKYMIQTKSSPLYLKPFDESSKSSQTIDSKYVEIYGDLDGFLKVKYKGNFYYVKKDNFLEIEDEKCLFVLGGMLIVNKNYYLPSDFNPGVNEEAKEKLDKMIADMGANNLSLKIISSFRSYDYQENLFSSYYREDGDYADTYSARAGHSEHQTGLAFDFSVYGENLSVNFENTPSFNFLNENAHKYGFILRYAKDKVSETGYIYEPWHFRYVGENLAKKIKDSGKSVEDYFNILN
ncbi:M15 family metallopeptidase [Citroniella saccharovorans]|uniref:M15 family metallopeptidase n=1 Tax=Citroniella saccharovorans TaxID=2053367 RepID=A0AAW9MRS3_9FIRM|nr:M15 family metallopeptidase [Citroniella saccharovorans]MEB3428665.1 M15 family metallopeptidase [Citroniella saccharovorans]